MKAGDKVRLKNESELFREEKEKRGVLPLITGIVIGSILGTDTILVKVAKQQKIIKYKDLVKA